MPPQKMLSENIKQLDGPLRSRHKEYKNQDWKK